MKVRTTKKLSPLRKSPEQLNMYEVEINQNKIGKALVRQQEEEKSRLKVAKRIIEQSKRSKEYIPQIEPVKDLAKDEQE